jgi:hypothetical protein
MKRLDFALRISPLALSALCAFAAPAMANSGANSALGIDTHFETKGMATHLGPVGFVSHNNNGAYDKSVHVNSVSETAPIVPQSPPPTIFLNGSNISSEVKNSGIQVDSETSEATSSVGHAALMLNLNPPPPTGAVPQPYLQVTGKNFTSSANFNTVFPSFTSAFGSSSLQNLKIFGSVLGSTVVTYSGSAAPNTVIYDSPTVTITLNKQVESGVISCPVSGPCTFKVQSITVEAVDISLNRAPIDGHKVSGDIVIAQAQAQ